MRRNSIGSVLRSVTDCVLSQCGSVLLTLTAHIRLHQLKGFGPLPLLEAPCRARPCRAMLTAYLRVDKDLCPNAASPHCFVQEQHSVRTEGIGVARHDLTSHPFACQTRNIIAPCRSAPACRRTVHAIRLMHPPWLAVSTKVCRGLLRRNLSQPEAGALSRVSCQGRRPHRPACQLPLPPARRLCPRLD